MTTTTEADGMEAGLLAAEQEYSRWSTEYDSRRPAGNRAWVCRNDGRQWVETTSHGSVQEAEEAAHTQALHAAVRAALATARPDDPDDMETCAPRKEPGQRAYEAFCDDLEWPAEWSDLDDVTQSRWARVEAALATPSQTAGVPEGHVVVPVEPSEAWLNDYWHSTGESREMRPRVIVEARKRYAAMIRAASPQSQEAEQ